MSIIGTLYRSYVEIDRVALDNVFNSVEIMRKLNKFTLTYRPHIGSVKQMKMYRKIKEGGKLHFPKVAVEKLHKLKMLNDITRSLPDIPDNVRIKGATLAPLFPNQEFTVDYLMKKIYSDAHIKGGIPGCNLIMGTGGGKSRCALAVAKHIGKKTLVVVPNDVILKGWVNDEIPGAYENPSEIDDSESKTEAPSLPLPTIGVCSGLKKTDGDVVVGIINSLLKMPKEFFEQFGFVVFDEAPDYCTDVFSEIFWIAQGVCSLGLTATPDEREDGFDKSLVYHLGPLIDVTKIPGFTNDGIVFTGRVEVIKYNAPDEFAKHLVCPTTGIFSAPLMIGMFITDPYRLALLVRTIKGLYDEGKHVYVFSEQTEYCRIMQRALGELGLVGVGGEPEVYKSGKKKGQPKNTDSAHIIMGGVTDAALLAAKSKCDRSVILTTYGYLRRGVSIPQMDTIVIATPRKSGFTQIIGRVLRRNGDTTVERVIVDLVDNSTGLKKQLSFRKKAYAAKLYPLKVSTVRWQDVELLKPVLEALQEEVKNNTPDLKSATSSQ